MFLSLVLCFTCHINFHLQDILHNTTLLLKPNLELSHTETGNHAFIIGMVALTSFEVLWVYPLWFPCFGKCSLCIIVASLLVKRCAWSVVVRGFELNTCTIYQIWCTRKKSMSVPIIISNWQCWKLFCPCIVIVIYWACALCVPAIIYTQGICQGKKKTFIWTWKVSFL